MTSIRLLLANLILGAALSACGQGPSPDAGQTPGSGATVTASATGTPAMEPADATSRDFGSHILYFNALRTSELTPDVARTYDIVRSPNRVMLNVSMVKKVEGSPGEPVAGKVEAQAVNLNGQFKNLVVREVREGSAVYYIGDVPVADDEALVFTVHAEPAEGGGRFSVRFSRDFQ
jgi:hypothetical protein